jgi:hypothetical protein
MIDAQDREASRQRFSADLAPLVAEAIGKALNEKQAEFGFSSAAAGADILFAEQLLERDGELHLVLSGPEESFRGRSVEYLKDDTWVHRFGEVMAQATNLTLASNHHPSDDSRTRLGEQVHLIRIYSQSLRPKMIEEWSKEELGCSPKLRQTASGISSMWQAIHAILFADVVSFKAGMRR